MFGNVSSVTGLQAYNSSNSPTKFIINPSGGNVGIGLTNPDSILHVAKSSTTNLPYTTNNALTSIYAYDPSVSSGSYHTIEAIAKELGTSTSSNYRVAIHGTLLNSAGNNWLTAGGIGYQNDLSNYAAGIVGSVNSTCPSGYTCYAGYFTGNVYTTGSYLPSDKRWKKNITPIENSIDLIKKIKTSKLLLGSRKLPK
ncbi:MAG: hypothetical protein KatS3mg090_0640 [Patescibacteria group bacterium]|nr:MAG: hypothetical protein KatS3mg090_0640 [Patescibacteria group bacterium]